MNKPDALITYDGLPISSGGAHTIRIRDHHLIWNKVTKFIETFTISGSENEAFLILYEGKRVDPNFFSIAYKRSIKLYGKPKRTLAVSGETDEYQNLWRLNNNRISEAIDFMTSLEPFPIHWLGGPLFLGIKLKFLLSNPDTKQALPYQGSDVYGGQDAGFGLPLGQSLLYLRLAHPSTCGLFLSFPYSTKSEELLKYIENYEEALPFKLSRKHWSRWQLNSQKTRYYNRKIEI